jgi:hypothetical protein
MADAQHQQAAPFPALLAAVFVDRHGVTLKNKPSTFSYQLIAEMPDIFKTGLFGKLKADS